MKPRRQSYPSRTRRPLDLWNGPLADYDGITEVMVQNHVWDIVDMDELDRVGNDEGMDRTFDFEDVSFEEDEDIVEEIVEAIEDGNPNIHYCYIH